MSRALPFDAPAAVVHLRSADPILAGVIDRVGPVTLELLPTPSVFSALLRSIVYQQLHGKAAATIHARVLTALRRHGGVKPAAVNAAGAAALRAAGLSRAKLAAVQDLAARCLAGELPSVARARTMPDEALVEALATVRGVGPWTVHMFLIFNLGRPDVLPTGDFAVRLAFQRLYRKRRPPTPEIIARHARCWQPYRSVASWYLWRSLAAA